MPPLSDTSNLKTNYEVKDQTNNYLYISLRIVLLHITPILSYGKDMARNLFVLTKDFFSLLRYINALLEELNIISRGIYASKRYLDVYMSSV